MIPPFADGENLPGGEHECAWGELLARFGAGQTRQRLCSDLMRLMLRAKNCGYLKVLIWRSFATSKNDPGDLDLLFVTPRDVSKDNVSAECAELLDSASSRERFGHDFMYCGNDPEVIKYFVRYLGYDYRVGRECGLLSLDISCI